MPVDAKRPEASAPFQAGEPCPFPYQRNQWAAAIVGRVCPGVMVLIERVEWRGRRWDRERQRVTVFAWSCTAGHRACQGPGCRNQAPRRQYNTRFCSDPCRLRAWRAERRQGAPAAS